MGHLSSCARPPAGHGLSPISPPGAVLPPLAWQLWVVVGGGVWRDSTADSSTARAVSAVTQVPLSWAPAHRTFRDAAGIPLPQDLWVREECPPRRHPSSAPSLEPGLEVAQPVLLLAG